MLGLRMKKLPTTQISLGTAKHVKLPDKFLDVDEVIAFSGPLVTASSP